MRCACGDAATECGWHFDCDGFCGFYGTPDERPTCPIDHREEAR